MQAHTPADLNHLFVKAMNEGDVEAMLALYEPDQVFVSQPGQPVARGAGAACRPTPTISSNMPSFRTPRISPCSSAPASSTISRLGGC